VPTELPAQPVISTQPACAVADLMFVTDALPTVTPGLRCQRCESFEELHTATPKRVVRGEGAGGPGGAGGGAIGHGGLGAGVAAGQFGQQLFLPAPDMIACASVGQDPQFVLFRISIRHERLCA
jgi:hypothetical protein